MTELSREQIQRLINRAHEARAHAHTPYSRFPVGAAVMGQSGTIFSGCNVEISSFSLTCCAERNAFFHAISCGEREFVAMAIVAGEIECPPCGACRQVLADFDPELPIILADIHGSYRITSLRNLFPHPFSSTHLDNGSDPA